jgi:hypothetical protein
MNGMGGMGGGSGGGMGGGKKGGGKKGGGKSPIANVRKRFMRSEMTQDEDGPILDVQIQGDEPGLDIGGPQGSLPVYRGEGSMGMEMPPREEMDMAAFNDVPAEPEFDALSEAAKRVYAQYADIDDLPSEEEMVQAGIPEQEATAVIDLLLGEDEGPGDEMTMAGMGGGMGGMGGKHR